MKRTLCFITCCLLLVTSACVESKRYTTYLESTNDDSKFDIWNEWGFSLNYLQVSDMSDRQKQVEINNHLSSAQTQWINKKVSSGATAVDPIVYCDSDRYLSIMTVFVYGGRRVDRIYNYVTMDMQTGKQVNLNDLIYTNDEFVKLLRDGDIVQPTVNAEEFDGNVVNLRGMLADMTLDELKTNIDNCSKNPTEFSYTDDLNELMSRYLFHIEPGKLVITKCSGMDSHIDFTFLVKDISDYLKVEPW